MSQVSRYLEAVQQRVIVFDGAMGTMIQNIGLEAADSGMVISFEHETRLAPTSKRP